MSRAKTGGRKAGSTNKVTANVKQALEDAFVKLGGVDALVEWGKRNPDEFFKLWGRMLPKEIKAEIEQHGTGHVVVYLPDDGRELPESSNQIESNANESSS